jgi:membrane protease subunit (stomatin/prohibitin family)
MGIIGDMSKFTQFQVAESMEAAAKNPSGGGASTGMGMGMGFGMANAMMGQMGSMGPGQPQQQSGPPPVPGAVTYFVAVNGQQSGPYDLNSLKQMAAQGQITKETLVWKQGMDQWSAAANQADLSIIFGAVPPPLPPK